MSYGNAAASFFPSFPPREEAWQRYPAPGSAPGLDLLLHLLLQVNLRGIPAREQAGAVRESQGNLVLAALVPREGGDLGTLQTGPNSGGAAAAENSTSRQELTHQGQELPVAA